MLEPCKEEDIGDIEDLGICNETSPLKEQTNQDENQNGSPTSNKNVDNSPNKIKYEKATSAVRIDIDRHRKITPVSRPDTQHNINLQSNTSSLGSVSEAKSSRLTSQESVGKKAEQKLQPFIEEDAGDVEESMHPKLVFTPEEPLPIGDKHPNGSPPIFKNNSNANIEEATNKLDFARSASAAQVAVQNIDRNRKTTPVSSRHGLQHISSKNHLHSNPSLLESVPEGKSSRVNSQEHFGKKLAVPKTPKRSPSTSSFQYMSTPFHGSTLSAFEKPSEFASQFSLKSVTDSLAPISYCCGCKKRPKDDDTKKEPSKYFDLELLKDPIYLVILISNCTCAISYTNFIILVPSYAQERGFDKTLGAYLLSIISALDLVGRIGGSALSDLVRTPKRYFFIFGLLLSGISLALIPLMPSYLTISIFCSIFGIASGINVGVTALVMTEMLGTERLMSSYGISLFVNGILQLIGPPICGFWYEYTNSYKSLFVTLGFILIFGAALWLLVPIIKRRRRIAEKNKNVVGKA